MTPSLPILRRVLLIATLAAGYFVLFPLRYGGADYVLSVATNVTVLSLISLGVWITFAIGRINISQGAFAMIGGYTTAILATRYGVPFWLCLPLSGLTAAFFGALIGWPMLRLRGVYCAMITLSLTEAVRLLALNGGELTNGATGIVNIPRPALLQSNLALYYLAGILLALSLLAVWRLSASRLGWVFRSLQQNEELAISLGINVAKYRVIAYGCCCFLGGVGGSFFAIFHQNIYPASYSVNDSVYFMLYCFLGGLDFIFGAVVGTFLLVVSFELLHEFQRYQALIYGVLMITFMLLLPNGILSLLQPQRRRPGR